MTPVLLTNVSATRNGRRVLHGICARFEPGRLTAVIGPNGAGKSTLLSVAAGLLRPDTGAILVGGRPIAEFHRRRLAQIRSYLPQNPQIGWPISVERLVALGLTPSLPLFGGLPSSLRGQVDSALERFDLLDLRDRSVDAMSGGERARAMLARAVVGDPEVLIVDEPTAGLDPRHALDAMRSLRAYADRGRAVITAMHDLDLAADVADDILALRDGRILAMGPVGAVFTEATLTRLYDLPARIVRRDSDIFIRFKA